VEAGYLAVKAFRQAWNACAGLVPALQSSAIARITPAEMTTAAPIRRSVALPALGMNAQETGFRGDLR